MRLCLSVTSSNLCQHPLPCPHHGTRLQTIPSCPCTLAWLIEPIDSGMLVTLIHDGTRASDTRWCATSDGEDGLKRLQRYLLAESGVAA